MRSATAPTLGSDLARRLAGVALRNVSTEYPIVHLHGLNLSRAWCWRVLLPHLPASLHASVTPAIAASLETSLPAASGGDYVGTHWLASFALLALT